MSCCLVAALVILAVPLILFAIRMLAPRADVAPPATTTGGRRTNILLLGIDRRQGTGWGYRTDTIMVLTLVPRRQIAGLLSIPRDLQLPIPTHGEDRINTANVYGYLEDYPGGGPALLRTTIREAFGIPIHAYVMIDFQAFEQIVDALGGIDLDVPQTLHDTRYPDPRPEDPYAYRTVHFDPGPQHMNGRRALVYARSRMSTSDFDRAARQQQVLLAILHQAMRLEAVPRWPALIGSLREGVLTDLGFRELLALAGIAQGFDPSRLDRVVLQPPLVYGYQRPDGAIVQLPNWERIHPVIAELFGSP